LFTKQVYQFNLRLKITSAANWWHLLTLKQTIKISDMQQLIKKMRLIGLLVLLGICFTTIKVNAQSPADDPGIGGPGSPSEGVGGDGGPVVPLDRDLSIALIAVGIAFGYKKVKQAQIVGIN